MSEQPSYWITEHKSGAYIAKTVELSPPRILVEMVAVVRHPLQGDLHHPYEPDVMLFHERRAAAYREKVWLPMSAVEPFEGEVPSYDDSLRVAWEQLAQTMTEWVESAQQPEAEGEPADPDRARWAAKSLEQLNQLKIDYWGK